MLDEVDVQGTWSRCNHSLERAATWIEARTGHDGSPPGDDPFFGARLPIALALTGRRVQGVRALRWLLDRVELLAPPRGSAPIERAEDYLDHWFRRYFAYVPSLVLHGAALLGHGPGIDTMLQRVRRLLAPCGAPWSTIDSEVDEVELVPACQAGIAFLAAGAQDEARVIGRWLLDVLEQQPEPTEALHMITTGSGRLVVDPRADADPNYYVVRRAEPGQHAFAPGIAVVLLVELAWRTGDPAFLAAATRLDRFARDLHPSQFEVGTVCKNGWGAAFLYAATGDTDVRTWLLRLGDWFVDRQADDGHWEPGKLTSTEPSRTLATLEFAEELSYIPWSLAFHHDLA